MRRRQEERTNDEGALFVTRVLFLGPVGPALFFSSLRCYRTTSLCCLPKSRIASALMESHINSLEYRNVGPKQKSSHLSRASLTVNRKRAASMARAASNASTLRQDSGTKVSEHPANSSKRQHRSTVWQSRSGAHSTEKPLRVGHPPSVEISGPAIDPARFRAGVPEEPACSSDASSSPPSAADPPLLRGTTTTSLASTVLSPERE